MRSSLRDRKSEKLAKKVTQYSAETMKRIQEIQELIDEPQELREQDDLTPEQVQSLSPSSFQKVSFNKAGAERTGFSNYSYWGSTLRMFMEQIRCLSSDSLDLHCGLYLHPAPPSRAVPAKPNKQQSRDWYAVHQRASR